MANQRTVTTLVLLLAAMTAGAFVLVLMETAPIRPSAEPLAAFGAPSDGPFARVVQPENVPLNRAKWRNIVVHSTGDEGDDLADQCHFLIGLDHNGEVAVEATRLWHDQRCGGHVATPNDDFNTDSIGICLVGDFADGPPSGAVLDALVSVTKHLQYRCRIGRASVYLYRHLSPSTYSPGRAFPEEVFTDRLALIER